MPPKMANPVWVKRGCLELNDPMRIPYRYLGQILEYFSQSITGRVSAGAGVGWSGSGARP